MGIQCSVLFCNILPLFVLFFFCVLYSLLFLYCAVSACDVRAAPLTGFAVPFPQL
jgi:hypothetical protein